MIPDWKDKTQYPGPNTTRRQWAWEFLRRNPRYQADYTQLQAQKKENRSWDERPMASKYGLGMPIFAPSDPDANRNVRFVNCLPRLRDDGWVIDCIETILSKHGASEALKYIGVLKTERQKKSSGYERAVVFNLDYPLAPQIRCADKVLRAMLAELDVRVPENRQHIENFQEYLRILDARACGATYAEIARTLYPRTIEASDKAKKAFRAALRLRDRDYLSIVR